LNLIKHLISPLNTLLLTTETHYPHLVLSIFIQISPAYLLGLFGRTEGEDGKVCGRGSQFGKEFGLVFRCPEKDGAGGGDRFWGTNVAYGLKGKYGGQRAMM
jgi:hypothetical protein